MKLKKYIFKIICLLLIVCLGVYVCIFAIPNAQDWDIYKQKEINTKIYTVWHIETFEGGGKSRVQYLKNIARSIEKENDGVLFMVSLISPQELSANIASTKPDIISFGFGVGKQILPILNELNNTYEIRDNLIKSATYGNKLMALPYIASGYAKITHAGEIDEWIYGTTGYTSPVLSKTATPISSQYEAYKQFIYNKKLALIGTARDIFRVSNLNNIGRLNASITPIKEHTDLIQYCGLSTMDENTLNFLKCLLRNENQMKLCEYSLFSVKNNKIYSSGIYSDMENAIFSATTPNVFE